MNTRVAKYDLQPEIPQIRSLLRHIRSIFGEHYGDPVSRGDPRQPGTLRQPAQYTQHDELSPALPERLGHHSQLAD